MQGVDDYRLHRNVGKIPADVLPRIATIEGSEHVPEIVSKSGKAGERGNRPRGRRRIHGNVGHIARRQIIVVDVPPSATAVGGPHHLTICRSRIDHRS